MVGGSDSPVLSPGGHQHDLRSAVERPKVGLESAPGSSSSSDSEPLEDLSRRGGRASPGAIVRFGGGSTPLLLVPAPEVSFMGWKKRRQQRRGERWRESSPLGVDVCMLMRNLESRLLVLGECAVEVAQEL
jgi:hypothetical protein